MSDGNLVVGTKRMKNPSKRDAAESHLLPNCDLFRCTEEQVSCIQRRF
jgi:hypothetical protein